MCVCLYGAPMTIEPIYKNIGAVIRAKRRLLDLAQEKLATQLGISRATLANIETGRQRVLAHQLYGFARALGVKPADLLPVSPPEADWTALPLPSDLKPEQKQQIAQLIGLVQTTPANTQEEANDQTNQTLTGKQRKGTA